MSDRAAVPETEDASVNAAKRARTSASATCAAPTIANASDALTGAPSMGDEAIRVATPMGSAISASASTATPNAFVAVRVPGVARASARAMSARAHIASMSPAGATTEIGRAHV